MFLEHQEMLVSSAEEVQLPVFPFIYLKGYWDLAARCVTLFFENYLHVLIENTQDFYAMGSGNTIAGSHFRGVDVNTATGLNDPSCAGVWAVLDTTNTANFQLASIALNCAGRTGKFDADFDFVINGQQLKCAGLTAGHPGGVTVTIYCAVSQNNAVACAGPGAVPIQMRFFPN